MTQKVQPASPISAYKQAKQDDSPRIPAVLRSRQKQQPQSHTLRRAKQLVSNPTEIVIDANRYNQQHGALLVRKQEGVRGEIDACLNAVEKVYQQQAKRKTSQAVLADVSSGGPVFSSNSIHRVDADLILKYIGTIRQDYGLTQRFGQFRKNSIISTPPQYTKQLSRNPEERFTSAEKRGSTKKSFINMTLSTNRANRPQSATKPINFTTHRAKSPRTIHSPLQNRHQQQNPPRQTVQRITEDFKFCISCEQSVLSCNINFHQKFQCKDLQQLYKLTFPQLRQLIAEKINRFRRTLHERLQQSTKGREKEELCEEVVESIQKYLNELQGDDETRELSFLQVRDSYLKFQQSLKGNFFDSIALTHKLDYFIRVYVQLTRNGNIQERIFPPAPVANQAKQQEELLSAPLPVSHFQPEH